MRAQNDRILDFLATGKGLTPLQAFKRFGCLRLSGRIYDLKREGHTIIKEMIEVGTGKRVARYRLAA